MPPAHDIQRHLYGAWRLMTGKPDGLRFMDISVDGFWNSFFAIVVALPALLIGWLIAANDVIGMAPDEGRGQLSLLMRLAVIDLGVWVIPIAGFVVLAKPLGLAGRVVHLVVAYNWGEALIGWLTLPVAVVFMIWSPERATADAIMIMVFLVVAALNWRLINAALDKGPALGSAVFAGIFVGSVVVLLVLESMLGVLPDGQVAG
jgi:hypothetical protein